jgi:TusE/DsrC/DsvC family sulfur relay protein
MNDIHHTMVSRVRIDTDGYLLDAAEWSVELATELAEAAGIETLSPNHWKIIRALREQYIPGDPEMFPEIRHFCARVGLDKGCVTRLFGDPLIAWQIAGLPKSGIDMSAYMPSSHLV